MRVLREEGGRTLVAKVLGETVYRRLALVERDLRTELPPPRDVPGLSCGWLDASGLDAYEALRPAGRERAVERFAGGQRCFGTWLGDRLVAVRWVATGAPLVEYLGIRLPLPRGEVYHYDTYTDPAQRRRGISAATQAHLFGVLRGEGFVRAVRAVLPENRAAVRDAASAGFETCGQIGFVRLGSWQHEFVRRRTDVAGAAGRCSGPSGQRRQRSTRAALGRARVVLAEEGLRSLWFKVLGETVYRRLLLLARDTAGPLSPVPFPDGLDFSFVEPSDARSLNSLAAQADSAEALRRLRRGDRCFVGRIGGRVVTARWVAVGEIWIPYLQRWLQPKVNEVFIYESFTHPAFRSQGVDAGARRTLLPLLAAEGVRTTVAAVLPEERLALRVLEKDGYRRIGVVGYVKIGPWRRGFLRRRPL